MVLKVDSMVGHHIGPNRTHPESWQKLLSESVCEWLNELMDQEFCKVTEQMLRSGYSRVHALGIVPASAILRDGTGWYKP